MDRSSELPTIGNPNTSREKRDRKGKVTQRRYYGGDGKAILNIDFDHDHGVGKPHCHDWDWTQDPPVRLPGRQMSDDETKGNK